MRAIVVIPTYNEHENLEPLVQQILQHTPGLHILIVDDNSPDGTGQVAEALREKNSSTVFVLHRRQKEGLGPAYVDAFRHVLDKGYEVILQMEPIFLMIQVTYLCSSNGSARAIWSLAPATCMG